MATTLGTGLITVTRLWHQYVDPVSKVPLLAIENIDLEVGNGEFVSILGQSGCGKTTLLYLLAGLIRPTGGEIRVDDHLVTGPGRDRGVVFQEYALLAWKTVRDNIALGPKIHGVPRAEREKTAQQFIDLVGISGFEDKYPHELSGGMRQRVAVARTLAADPKVILMDEPFAAVDAQTRITLQDELVRIWKETGKTIIFVTHSVEEAAFLADRVIVLTPRPARIKEMVLIPTPRSARRDLGNMEHAAIFSRLLTAVREGIAHTEEQQESG